MDVSSRHRLGAARDTGRAFDATGSYASLLTVLATALGLAAATNLLLPRCLESGQCRRNSRCQFSGCEVVLRRNTEGVCDTIEEREQGGDVYRFGNLAFLPPCNAQFLDILLGRSVSSIRDQLHIFQQSTLRQRQAGLVKLAFYDCFYTLIGRSLNPQEVGVAVQSIRTPVQIGDVAGNHLFVTARKMPFREMDGVP